MATWRAGTSERARARAVASKLEDGEHTSVVVPPHPAVAIPNATHHPRANLQQAMAKSYPPLALSLIHI